MSKSNDKKFIYNADLGGYMLSSMSKKIKHILTPEAYVQKYNNGEFNNREVWAQHLTSKYVFINEVINEDIEINKHHKLIPSGVFMTSVVSCGGEAKLVLSEHSNISDEYYELSNFNKELLSDVNFFLNNKKRYKSLGLAHRRGFLLFGPQGEGNGDRYYHGTALRIGPFKLKLIDIHQSHTQESEHNVSF